MRTSQPSISLICEQRGNSSAYLARTGCLTTTRIISDLLHEPTRSSGWLRSRAAVRPIAQSNLVLSCAQRLPRIWTSVDLPQICLGSGVSEGDVGSGSDYRKLAPATHGRGPRL